MVWLLLWVRMPKLAPSLTCLSYLLLTSPQGASSTYLYLKIAPLVVPVNVNEWILVPF
jgi:hypothetical protein